MVKAGGVTRALNMLSLTPLCYQGLSCQRALWLWQYIGHSTPLVLGLLYHFSWLCSFDLMLQVLLSPLCLSAAVSWWTHLTPPSQNFLEAINPALGAAHKVQQHSTAQNPVFKGYPVEQRDKSQIQHGAL